MWSIFKTNPAENLYPSPGANLPGGKLLGSDPTLETANPAENEKHGDFRLNPEEQKLFDNLAQELETKALPSSQAELSAADNDKVTGGQVGLLQSNANVLNGLPSLYLAYTYNEVNQVFPNKDEYWKLNQARKLSHLLKAKTKKVA